MQKNAREGGGCVKNTLYVHFIKKLALILVIIQMIIFNVYASENVLSLYKNKPSDNIPFSVSNMFPGDREKNDYCVRVSYNGTITVYFTADVRPDSEYKKLAEVLMCRVVMVNDGGADTILYDNLMRDMPDVPHVISGVNATEDLKYEIEVYLNTSVGNDYQNKELVADFKWWADTENNEGGSGGGPIGPANPDRPPVDPDEPDRPPVDPDDPDRPPVDPDDPDRPPVDPDEPDRPPVDPDEPDKPPDVPSKPPAGELIDPPNTGDYSNPILWIVLICISLFVVFLILFIKKKNEKQENKIIRKLTICIAIIIVLAICLCITTFALVRHIVTVDNNEFRTGTVKINLNDGEPIITENEFLFEPGMTVVKDFFIKNESSDSVYYKVYLDGVKGGLAKVLDIKIRDNKTGDILYSGTADEFTRDSIKNKASDELLLNEKRILTAIFHYPEESGNNTKNQTLEFDMCAVATQTRNNPKKEFN